MADGRDLDTRLAAMASLALLIGGLLLSPVSAAREAASPSPAPLPTNASKRSQLTAASQLFLRRLHEAFSWGLHLDSDLVSNRRGGLQTGTANNTVLHVGLGLNTETLDWWRGGRLRLDLEHQQGDRPSTHLVGDAQGVSNLEAPPANQVYAAWYAQRLGDDALLRVGLIDLNAYFVVTEAAGSLINSSFGITPTFTGNVPTSTFPKPGYGLMLQSREDRWQGRVGVFQGDPNDRSSLERAGEMALGEMVHRLPGPQGAIYKLGVWQYANPRLAGAAHGGLYGMWVQPLTARGARERSRVFLQWGANPGAHGGDLPYYLGLGADLAAPFDGRAQDRFTFGLARAWLRDLPAETVYEVSYLRGLTRSLFLQPDAQYVRHPSGTLPDAWVLILRLHFTLYE